MAMTLAQIEKQIKALQHEADAIKASEKSEVVARIRQAIAHYSISAAELGLTGGATADTGVGAPRKARGPYKKRGAGEAAPKSVAAQKTPVARYSDGAGNNWSGRGPKPRWFKAALAAGKTLQDLTS